MVKTASALGALNSADEPMPSAMPLMPAAPPPAIVATETAGAGVTRRRAFAEPSVARRLSVAELYASHGTLEPKSAEEPAPLALPLVQFALPATTAVPARTVQAVAPAETFSVSTHEFMDTASEPHAHTMPKVAAGKLVDVPVESNAGQKFMPAKKVTSASATSMRWMNCSTPDDAPIFVT